MPPPLSSFLVFLSQWFPVISIAGVALLSLCTLVASLFYTGRRDERYSFFNHYISELGERGVSHLAWLFNTGLIVGGLCFLFFIIGLGLALQSLWGWLGLAAGIVASLACSLVGFFPMNNLRPHILAAMIYFRAGLLTVLFFGIAILTQPAPALVHPLSNLAGLLALSCYSSFLVVSQLVYRKTDVRVLDPSQIPARPRFWILAILEWAIFVSTIVWFFSIALAINSL